jgi:hypothetical protein
MVVTPPQQMIWLSPNDLRAMGTTITGKPDQTRAPNAQTQVMPINSPCNRRP